MQGTHLHGALGAVEVHHTEVANDQADVHQVAAHALRPALGLEADAGNHVHLTADEHASVVVRYEERIEVVDAVARQAAHAEDRGLRLLVVADAGQIGLAPAVDLGRADHGVAATAPDAFEDPLETQVARIDRKSTRLNSSHSQISHAVF